MTTAGNSKNHEWDDAMNEKWGDAIIEISYREIWYRERKNSLKKKTQCGNIHKIAIKCIH